MDYSCHFQGRTVEEAALMAANAKSVQDFKHSFNTLFCGMQRNLFKHPNLSKFLFFHTALFHGMGMLEACRQHVGCRFEPSFQNNVDK